MKDDPTLFTRTAYGLTPCSDSAREKKCLVCKAVFKVGKRGPKRFALTKYCSRKCRGVGMSDRPEDRFWANVTGEPNSGCFLWVGGTDSNGYAPFQYKNTKTRAHRFAYEQFVGPIPRGLHVLHSCDVPACVNPKHLRVGTHQENMADMILRKRNAFGARMKNTNLTDDDVRYIRKSNETCRVLAERYEVGQMTISEIKRRVRWRHVE